MIINKNTWHYKVYEFSYWLDGWTPGNTNLCTYMRRILFIAPLVAIAMGVMSLFAGIWLGSVTLVTTSIGYKPFNAISTPLSGVEKYKGLQIGKSMLYPYHAILTVVCGLLNYFILSYLGWKWYVTLNAVAFGLLACVNMYLWISKSETCSLVWDYLAAKKQGFCPVVKFEEK